MSRVSAIGMVIYTYDVLEKCLDDLWEWLQRVESWSGELYAEFHYSSRAKESQRIWKATAKNRANLHHLLQTEQPWLGLDFGYPAGTLEKGPSTTRGLYVSVVSREQPLHGMERYRMPSYVYLETHSEVLSQSVTGVPGFLNLGKQVWEFAAGTYGFIDVEIGIPLQDRILRNAAHLFDSTVPPEYRQEFRQWQKLMPQLSRRVWKAFWGNFLSAEHLRQLGGIQELRHADPHYRLLPKYLEQAYQKGVTLLRACGCYEEWQELTNEGILVTLAPSPMDWFDPSVQERRSKLQAAIEAIALQIEPEVAML
jgi:hypothetical protein